MTTKRKPRKAPESPAPEQEKAVADPARDFALKAARLAADTKCRDVLLLDVRSISPVTDYFLIATGSSPRQMRTVCDELAELGQQQDMRALSISGYESETWILADFVNVIVHLFNQESRGYYDLDNLWGDAPRVQL